MVKRLWFIPPLFLLALIAFRFAEPFSDGDLFWQMAYGKQFLERHTLIPDHTLYSWTDAHNGTIYCAWLTEILLYQLYQLGGAPLLFLLRYLVVVATVLLPLSFARRVGVERRPETWLALVVMVLAGYVGTYIEPQLFSYAFLTLLAWLLYRLKAADWAEQKTLAYLVAIPLLMCVWANSHGVYIFGIVILSGFVVSEVLNYFLSPGAGLRLVNLKALLIAWLCSGLAICLTPYGIAYPLQNFQEFLGITGGGQSEGDKIAELTVGAHVSTLQAASAFHFRDNMAIMALFVLLLWCYRLYLSDRINVKVALAVSVVSCAVIALSFPAGGSWRILAAVVSVGLLVYLTYLGRKAGSDLGFLYVNALLAVIYLWYVRTTFYWPPFLVFSSLFFYHQCMTRRPDQIAPKSVVEPKSWSAPICFILSLMLCVRGIQEAYFSPYAGSWCGFGNSYVNPELEADFLAKYDPDLATVYNDYDGGAYLLWRFYPKMKVMIDARSFPYRHFYADYINYELGDLSVDDFQKKFAIRPEVSIVSLKSDLLWRSYLSNPDWSPAFVGLSSVIFVRKGHSYPPEAKDFAADRFDRVRSSERALQIFKFGVESHDYAISWKILQIMHSKFATASNQKLIENLDAYKEFVEALDLKDVDKAIELQERCRHLGFFYANNLLINLYRYKVQGLARAGHLQNDPIIIELTRKFEKVNKGEDPSL